MKKMRWSAAFTKPVFHCEDIQEEAGNHGARPNLEGRTCWSIRRTKDGEMPARI